MYENGKMTLFKRHTANVGGENWTIDHVEYRQRHHLIEYWRAYTDKKDQYIVGTTEEAVRNDILIHAKNTKK